MPIRPFKQLRVVAAVTATAMVVTVVGAHSALAINPIAQENPAFTPGTVLNEQVQAVDIFEENGQKKFLLGGEFTDVGDAANDHLTIMNDDGSIDATFSPGASISDPTAGGSTYVYAVKALSTPSGWKFLVGGQLKAAGPGEPNEYIGMFDRNGNPDPTFAPGNLLGGNGVHTIQTVELEGQTRFFIGGSFSNLANKYATVLNQDGQQYDGFDIGSRLGSDVYTSEVVEIDGQKRLFLGGAFTDVGEAANDYQSIFNLDGSLYTSYAPGDAVDDYVRAVEMFEVDGAKKFLIGGEFYYAGPADDMDYVAAFNADGSYYEAFNPASNVGGDVNDVNNIWVNGELKFLIASNSSIGNNDHVGILNLDGTVYTPFDPEDTIEDYTYVAKPVTIDGVERILFAGDLATPTNNWIGMFVGFTIPAPTATLMTPVAGPLSGGEEVTITGTNLRDAHVTFGGVACTDVQVDFAGTTVKCKVPAGAAVGLVTVTVTTPGGSVEVPGGYTYTGNSAGTVSVLRLAPQSVAGRPTAIDITVTHDGQPIAGEAEVYHASGSSALRTGAFVCKATIHADGKGRCFGKFKLGKVELVSFFTGSGRSATSNTDDDRTAAVAIHSQRVGGKLRLSGLTMKSKTIVTIYRAKNRKSPAKRIATVKSLKSGAWKKKVSRSTTPGVFCAYTPQGWSATIKVKRNGTYSVISKRKVGRGDVARIYC